MDSSTTSHDFLASLFNFLKALLQLLLPWIHQTQKSFKILKKSPKRVGNQRPTCPRKDHQTFRPHRIRLLVQKGIDNSSSNVTYFPKHSTDLSQRPLRSAIGRRWTEALPNSPEDKVGSLSGADWRLPFGGRLDTKTKISKLARMRQRVLQHRV